MQRSVSINYSLMPWTLLLETWNFELFHFHIDLMNETCDASSSCSYVHVLSAKSLKSVVCHSNFIIVSWPAQRELSEIYDLFLELPLWTLWYVVMLCGMMLAWSYLCSWQFWPFSVTRISPLMIVFDTCLLFIIIACTNKVTLDILCCSYACEYHPSVIDKKQMYLITM